MIIEDIISIIKENYLGLNRQNEPIDKKTTRDQILYGNPKEECKGIVITCFASIDVIKEAIKQKKNLIICHEALFWNSGDHQGWLTDNSAYKEKIKYLNEGNIVVWRNHDYIHSGMKIDSKQYSDGIFYGIMKELKWEPYLISEMAKPLVYEIPEISLEELSAFIIDKFNLKGLRVIGSKTGKVKRIYFTEHVMGRNDQQKITFVNDNCIDVMISMELVDYTLSEYVRDASMAGQQKSIFCIGHFNTEELGMKYLEKALKNILKQKIDIKFVSSCDMFDYMSSD